MLPVFGAELHSSWWRCLEHEFAQPYMRELQQFLQAEVAAGKVIYPERHLIFNAFNCTPFDQVKVVILGQDPYHGPGQAHGLSFSVLPGVRKPPSLVNIFKELTRSHGLAMPAYGCLQNWAAQGVLLLNATLTVEQGNAGSHQNKGWETFTDAVISQLNQTHDNLVFVLWGAYAQKKGRCIDASRHRVLSSVHPSPLSAHRGFIGCDHFTAIDQYLVDQQMAVIDWKI